MNRRQLLKNAIMASVSATLLAHEKSAPAETKSVADTSINSLVNSLANAVATSFLARLKRAPCAVEAMDGSSLGPTVVKLERRWRRERCTARITNVSNSPIVLKNIVLFDLNPHGLDPATSIFAESFQMLALNGGTLGVPADIGDYQDRNHYRIPEPDGLRTAYGLITLSLDRNEHALLGFGSCRRFIGRFSYGGERLRISVDPEGLTLAPGEMWRLEEFIAALGPDRDVLLKSLATRLKSNHPTPRAIGIPTGWCSWYCYGDAATRPIVNDNMVRFAEVLPEIRYIQIDDGYSPYEGDWLDPNPAFGDMLTLMDEIRSRGFEPAMWAAPFIAEPASRVFREHPDWFVKGADGSPLNSSHIGFGGWRHGPWYVLDGTHPEARAHLETVFRTMRERWGVHYFKLDANYWGAIHGGVHYDKSATRIEAYRLGMAAVRRGAGPDAVILGCNAPMWPSIGEVTAMRIGDDISRGWRSLQTTAFQNFHRNWMNGTLWMNDPDAVVLAGAEEPPNSMFHATAIHAVGGLVLSGDRAMDLDPAQVEILKKLMHATGRGAVFQDEKQEAGMTDLGDRQYYYLFNYGDVAADRAVRLKRPSHMADYWSGSDLGVHGDNYTVAGLPPRSARLLVGTAV